MKGNKPRSVNASEPDPAVSKFKTEKKHSSGLGWIFSKWFFQCHPRRCNNPHGIGEERNGRKGNT